MSSCTERTGRVGGGDGGRDAVVLDGGFDPFDPANQCGASVIPTDRVPGSVIVVFDRSSSMATNTSPNRWQLATGTMMTSINAASDSLNVGLLFFPGSDGCRAGDVEVDVGPLSLTRAMIGSAFANTSPSGDATPIVDAVWAGWDAINQVNSGNGERAVILVTDGGETCADPEDQEILLENAARLRDAGILTYVVGLEQSNGFLSRLAVQGGTRRTPSCVEVCGGQATTCDVDSDCPNGQRCAELVPIDLLGIFPGQCSCENDGQCDAGLTCEPGAFGLTPAECTAPPSAECCHYTIGAGNFQTDFQAVLTSIAGRFTSGCVFQVPTSQQGFDPSLVNVGVTFDGQPRQVLGRSSNPAVDSWDFRDGSFETLQINGPICEQLRSAAANVEIVLGCPQIIR